MFTTFVREPCSCSKTRILGTMSSKDSQSLHMLFFPCVDPGHMQPMLGMAELFAGRAGVRVSILTTPGNVRYVEPSLDRAKNIKLHTIPFPSKEAGLPQGCENAATVPKHLIYNYMMAFPMLRKSYDNLVRELLPDCVVTDAFFYWAHPVTAELDIPRIVLDPTSFFSMCVSICMNRHVSQDGSVDPESSETVVIPGLCHRIEMHRSQFPTSKSKNGILEQIKEANSECYGQVANSFDELEPDYVKQFEEEVGIKVWALGPVAPRNKDNIINADDGKSDDCLKWLDSKSPGSVLYVCFGGTGNFTREHIEELALGLEASDHPFVWVAGRDGNKWIPDGFEERVVGGGKGLIIRGWAPQVLILDHPSVGGFLTHCGWSSCLEGVTAGLPLATWPMLADQFSAERLIVDVLKIGVSMGTKIWSMKAEEREVVEAETVKKVVNEVMGSGEEADGRRRKAKELGEMARKAVEKGGSSYTNMDNLIQDLIDHRKKNRN